MPALPLSEIFKVQTIPKAAKHRYNKMITSPSPLVSSQKRTPQLLVIFTRILDIFLETTEWLTQTPEDVQLSRFQNRYGITATRLVPATREVHFLARHVLI